MVRRSSTRCLGGYSFEHVTVQIGDEPRVTALVSFQDGEDSAKRGRSYAASSAIVERNRDLFVGSGEPWPDWAIERRALDQRNEKTRAAQQESEPEPAGRVEATATLVVPYLHVVRPGDTLASDHGF